MARAFYSVVLDHPADEVWAVIRPFGHYAWAGVEGETIIEDGRADDQVGAVRRVQLADRVIRQKLLAHSDVERSYTYHFCEPAPVAPVVESGKAFVGWSATFDCPADDCGRWIDFFEKDGFAKWLAALGRFMDEAKS